MPRTQADRLPLIATAVFLLCLIWRGWVALVLALGMVAYLAWQVRKARRFTPTHGIPLVLFGVLAALNLALLLLAADPGPTGPTETFVTFCDLVFQGEGQVMAPSGQAVTDAFVAQHQADYAAGNYDALWQAVQAEELSLATDTATLSP